MPLLRVKRHMRAISSRQAVQGVAEGDQLRQSGVAQLVDGAQQAGNQLLALPARLVFLQQQVAEALFVTIDDVQGRVLGQVGQQAGLLLGLEVMAMAAHQRQQATMFGPHWIDLPPAGQKSGG